MLIFISHTVEFDKFVNSNGDGHGSESPLQSSSQTDGCIPPLPSIVLFCITPNLISATDEKIGFKCWSNIYTFCSSLYMCKASDISYQQVWADTHSSTTFFHNDLPNQQPSARFVSCLSHNIRTNTSFTSDLIQAPCQKLCDCFQNLRVCRADFQKMRPIKTSPMNIFFIWQSMAY